MSIDTTLAAALVRLTVDLSGGDAGLEAKAREIVADPPRAVEEVGFYGMAKAPAAERAVRAVLFRLSEAGHIHGFEDKYVTEMIDVLIDEGVVPADHGDAAIALFTNESLWRLFEDRQEGDGLEAMLAERFPAAMRALEATIAATGRELLYIDMPRGDTLHYIAVTPDIARRWKDVILYREGGKTIAITGPRWDHYWAFFAYAARLPEDAPAPTLPPYPVERLKTVDAAGIEPW